MTPSPNVSPEDWLTDSYDYVLPETAIAQTPVEPRDLARLLVIGATQHHHSYFYDLPQWLRAGDLLVVNNTRVIPARLFAHKSTGSRIEILLLQQQGADQWLALVKPGRRVKVGDWLDLGWGVTAEVLAHDPETRGRVLRFVWPGEQSFFQILNQLGEMPLPPYITSRASQPEDYQTLWAERPGSVAAPTAGLHFTPSLVDALKHSGIPVVSITLNVGLGTFRPVEVSRIQDHAMHREWLEVPEETVAKIRATQAAGGRVIAVGTTVARALESAAHAHGGMLHSWQGESDIFIYPSYRWRVVQGLITNFHLPRSTLMMMVSALVGRQRLLMLYEEALTVGYRFFSFGDGMIILPPLTTVGAEGDS
ncbi:MAG: tRNA preQ1(34) S-adenosylmethionine ribosyltransferase-isomerase QueA [Synechococcales cyanobacterium]